jgi:hypothetical protein
MGAQAEKVRENRLRRMAERQGLTLVKSRRRDPRALDYGRWTVLEAASNRVVADEMDSPHGLTIKQVEAYLTGDAQRR